MNKKQIEVEKAKLEAEAKELKHLKAIYSKAADDISNKLAISNGKINVLLKDFDELDDVQKSILQSQIYQRNFQLSLKKQIDGFMKELNSGQYESIDQYLKGCYETGFLGAMYDIHGQGIPIISPIDQKQVIKAKDIDSKISKKLYTKLGEDVDVLKKRIANNISRGIATADSYSNIARNISSASNVGFNNAMRIARTEGHRIQAAAAFDAQHKAKDAGADIVKQWDSTLDGRTRDTHRLLDGQIRELDEPFEVYGHKARFPSDFGMPSEDINCRCALLQRARWALDEDELETLKERAAFYGLDKAEDFNDFKQKYLKAAEASDDEYQKPINSRKAAYKARQAAKQTKSDVPVNRFGKQIEFDEKILNDSKWDESVSIIKELSGEYNTRLEKVTIGAEKGAGQVQISGAVMKLSSKEPHVAVHEFAHSLSVEAATKYGISDDSEFWKEIRKINRKYKKASEGHPEIWISSYEHSSGKIDEFFAEAFAQAKMSELGMKLPAIYGKDLTYSNEVLEVVNKYFKKETVKSMPKGFVPAKSIDEAEEYIKKFVDSSGFGATGISYNGISVESANAVNEALEKLYDRFNIDKLGGVYVAKGNTKLGKAIDGATAAYSPIRKSLLINNKSLKNPDVFLKSRKEELEIIKKYKEDPSAYTFKTKRAEDVAKASLVSGRATVPDTVEDVINHEMGHSIEKIVAKADGYETVKANMSKYADKISGYATTNESEYIAESFASYLKGEGLIDPDLEKIFKGLERNG